MGIPTETICALATPPGTGGIGVVRVSGPAAFAACDRVLRHARSCSRHKGHTLHRASVIDPESGDEIDDVLVTVFHAPRSYTGEDVVEISCHGGPVPLRRTVSALLAAGARMAEPGEFTLRAYLNGKMDLAQAEAVCDIITARTVEAHRLAQSQQAGRLSGQLHALRDDLMAVLARIEASIDFPEDVGELDEDLCGLEIAALRAKVDALIATADSGILMREGALVALAGRPNAGKSSLMNALLRTSRAIVTPIPGTTRDVIEETMNVHGIPVRLADTAGLRESGDPVEQLGVARTRSVVDEAALVLLVVDGSVPPAGDLDLLPGAPPERVLVVENKADIACEPLPRVPGASVVSALTGEGLGELEERMAGALLAGSRLNAAAEHAVITHARHRDALVKAGRLLEETTATLAARMPPDFLAIDVRGAISAIEEITGHSTPDDIINEIFSRFCIGK